MNSSTYVNNPIVEFIILFSFIIPLALVTKIWDNV